MKQLTTLLLLLLTFTVKAQYTTLIHGSEFHVEVNEANRTATITDYSYNIDDSKYPLSKNRKFKKIDQTLTIPETIMIGGKEYTVTGIGRAAFADYKNFSFVAIPETIISIGDYAFFNTNLVDINIPANVISVGKRAFGNCTKLGRISFPDALDLQASVYGGSPRNIRVERQTGVIPAQKINHNMAYDNVPDTKVKTAPTEAAISDVDLNLPSALKEADDNTFVVIIANENYYNEQKVDYAVKDGRMFKEYCLNVLGIPSRQIHFAQNATLNIMRQEVNWLKKIVALSEKPKIIFYYSGHGTQGENEISSLLPVDGSASDERSGYALSDLYDTFGSFDSKYVCVFLDACFSGQNREGELLVASRGMRSAAEFEPKGNMVVFSAAKQKETAYAYHDKGHGLFTYYLLKKLKESNGTANFGELADYISRNVMRTATLDMTMSQTPTTSASAGIANVWRTFTLTE